MDKQHSCKKWDILTQDTGGIEINGNGEILQILTDFNCEPTKQKILKFKFCPYCKEELQ
jgi:hypothetical protein